MIASGQLHLFVHDAVSRRNEREMWEYWLLRVAGQTFAEWRESVLHPEPEEVSQEDILAETMRIASMNRKEAKET